MSTSESNVVAVLARVYVDDIEAAAPLYEALTQGERPHRFNFRDMHLAKIGSFLLVQGADEGVRSHSATVAVRNVGIVAEAISAASGELLEGPDVGPNGPRLVARHPDGTIVEYIQLGLPKKPS